MKKLFTYLCLVLITETAFCQVKISGEFKNAPPGSEVSVTYYNNSIEWNDVSAGKTKLDAQGRFTLSFNLIKAEPATLIVAEQQTNLFLLPDDSLHITDDYSSFDSTIAYTGRGAPDNNYLAAEALVDFNKKANRYTAFNDAEKYKLYQDSIEKVNWDFFKLHDNHQLSADFRKFMTSTVKYRFINSRWMYKVGYDRENKKFFDKPVPENYFDFLKNLNLNDQDAIDNVNYQVALVRYLFEMNDSETQKEIPDSLTKVEQAEMRITKDYNFRKKVFTGRILDFELTTYLKQNIGLVVSDQKYCDELLKDYKVNCKNQEYVSIIDKINETAKRLTAGNVAPDFTLVDTEGKTISLSSLKGKTVYVDFWATWCKPCIAAMKHSHELMEKFKDRNDIVFLYVNVSDDKEKWKNYLVKDNMQGVNLFANQTQSDDLFKVYNFDGIPHYVLIDKQGKLVNANEAGPADAEGAILQSSR